MNNETFEEMCPYCGTINEYPAIEGLAFMQCKNCKKLIKTCSMCYPNEVNCNNCELDRLIECRVNEYLHIEEGMHEETKKELEKYKEANAQLQSCKIWEDKVKEREGKMKEKNLGFKKRLFTYLFTDFLDVIIETLKGIRRTALHFVNKDGQFYVYNPNGSRPKKIHTTFDAAYREAKRIADKEQTDDIQVLQLVSIIPAPDEIPF